MGFGDGEWSLPRKILILIDIVGRPVYSALVFAQNRLQGRISGEISVACTLASDGRADLKEVVAREVIASWFG